MATKTKPKRKRDRDRERSRAATRLDSKPLGEVFKRELEHQSLKDLAILLEVSDSWIRDITRGVYPTVDLAKVDRLLVKLDIPLSLVYPD